MHGSSCPKCGAASDGSSKSCGSCGAVSWTINQSISPSFIHSLSLTHHHPTSLIPKTIHPYTYTHAHTQKEITQ
ncbi:hypothetical protein QR685DRAFT_525221 [Neurospora intermedia]|uniref:Uncharacterized protein n=1 Tax=Neurospora intermedia TaxID=5142 RepID=A0ABR3DE92_NEUIN